VVLIVNGVLNVSGVSMSGVSNVSWGCHDVLNVSEWGVLYVNNVLSVSVVLNVRDIS